MTRLTPVPDDKLPEGSKAFLALAEQMMGFTANDARVMARNPAIMQGVSAMVQTVYGQGKVDNGLKRLVGYIASTAAGCVYCQGHTAFGAHNHGVESSKIKAAWDYETSPFFTKAERAALRVAQGGAMSPSEVTAAQMDELKAHFDEDEIVEIIAVIAMFGFLNRWNAILQTEIEDAPSQFLNAAAIELR